MCCRIAIVMFVEGIVGRSCEGGGIRGFMGG